MSRGHESDFRHIHRPQTAALDVSSHPKDLPQLTLLHFCPSKRMVNNFLRKLVQIKSTHPTVKTAGVLASSSLLNNRVRLHAASTIQFTYGHTWSALNTASPSISWSPMWPLSMRFPYLTKFKAQVHNVFFTWRWTGHVERNKQVHSDCRFELSLSFILLCFLCSSLFLTSSRSLSLFLPLSFYFILLPFAVSFLLSFLFEYSNITKSFRWG